MSHFDSILADFNAYLTNRFNYKKDVAYIDTTRIGAVLVAKRRAFDLYIRFINERHESWANKLTIVIARVSFHKTRAGHGSDLLFFLTQMAVKYGYESIEIECANENSSAFAIKKGFHEVKCEGKQFFSTRDYRISIMELAKNIGIEKNHVVKNKKAGFEPAFPFV